MRDRLIRAHIAALGKPLVYVNTAGAADNGKNIIPFDGESLVYDASGRLIAIGRQFAEELLRRRRRSGSRLPCLRSSCPPIDRDREMYDALVMALRDYMRKTGFIARDRRGLGRDRFGAGAGHCRRRARCGSRLRLQLAVAIQQRDAPGRSPSGWRARSGSATA